MKSKIKFYTRKNNNQSQRLMVVKEYIERDQVVNAKILLEIR